jgi:hypothetical protein
MNNFLLEINAEEYDHLCIAMDAHLDYLRDEENNLVKDDIAEDDLKQKIKCAERFYEKCKRLTDKQTENEMNPKDLIEKALPYLGAYASDLKWQHFSYEIEGANEMRSGTPCFGEDHKPDHNASESDYDRYHEESTKEAEQYMSELKTLIEELDKAVNKTHQVTITGSISTTVTLKAKNEEEAIAKAHSDFQKNLGDAHDYVDWLEETVEEVKA